jgi:hypothetical protein
VQKCITNPEEVIYARKKAAAAAAPAKPMEPLRAEPALKAGEEVEAGTEAVPEGTPLVPEGTWGTPPVGPWGMTLLLTGEEVGATGTVE